MREIEARIFTILMPSTLHWFFKHMLIMMSYFSILMYQRLVNSSEFDDCMVCFQPVCCPWRPHLFYEMLVNRSEVTLLDLDEYMPSPGLWDWFGRTDSYRVHDVLEPFLFVYVIVFSWDTLPFCLGWFQIRKVGSVLECPTSNVDIDGTSRLGSGKRNYLLLFFFT